MRLVNIIMKGLRNINSGLQGGIIELIPEYRFRTVTGNYKEYDDTTPLIIYFIYSKM